MTQTTMYAGHVNSPFTLLSAGITDVATTVPVLELGVFPTAPNVAVIGTGSDAETIYYGAKSAATGAGNLTSVTREWNKTGTYGAKKAWLAGTVISRRFTEYDHATFKANIEDHETWKISKAIVDAKGDLIVATAADTVARHAIGTDLYPLVAKSAVTNGMAWEQLTEGGIVLADVTTLNVSTSKHGLVPKAPNDTSQYLRGDGTWSALSTPDILIYKGVIDCAANPNYPAADAGHTYLVSVAGKIGGASGPAVEVGDMIICCVDSSASGDHATVGANWSVLQSVVTETNLTLADVTTNDASTTKHGFAPKAVAPAAGLLSALGIGNGETAYTCKPLFDTTNPELLGTIGPGTSLLAARRDHVHGNYTAAGVGIGIGLGAAPSYLLHIKGTAATDLPTYSAEFLDADNWTSTDWTGSWAAGWDHTTGNTTVLSHDHAAVNATKYQIAYTVTGRTAGTFTITFGGQSLAGISATGAWGPTTTGTGVLQITPTSDFDGAIIISIKSLTAAATPIIKIDPSGAGVGFSVYVNNGAGNLGFGDGAGKYITTGESNTCVGQSALSNITTGSYNTAIGYASLIANTTGSSNIAIGGSALYTNKTGYYNSAIGTGSLFSNTTGYQNTAIGYYTLYTNTIGSANVAIGNNALYLCADQEHNVAIGNSALYNCVGGYNVAIGVSCGLSITSGTHNTMVGKNTGRTVTTGGYNTFVGDASGYDTNQKIDAVNSAGFGANTFTTRSNQIVIGDELVVETQLRTGVYIGSTSTTAHTQPTARLHIAAGSATASTAPLKFTSGPLNTTAEAGAIEFLTDDFYATITTAAARKCFVLDDGARLTSGKIPIATTNGRLIDGQTPLAGTKVYYVADSSGGAVTRKLTFVDGILTAET